MLLVLKSLLLFLYFLFSYCFIFSVGSLFRVFMIVLSSLDMSLLLYMMLGFSWYLLLFILVYVGGVYVLFIYVSLVSPNVGLVTYRLSNVLSCMNVVVLFMMGFLSFFVIYSSVNVVEDNSVYLCSSYEFSVYLFFCIMLMLGLVIINLMVCSVSNYCYAR